MKKSILLVLLVLVATSLVFAGGSGERVNDINVFSGPSGGSWAAGGTVVGKIFQENFEDTVTVTPGAALSNVAAVMDGSATVAFCKSNTTVDALNGVAPFGTPQNKLANIAFLNYDIAQIAVYADSDIYSVEDLRGKKVGAMSKGSAGEVLFSQILASVGMTYEDLDSVSYGGNTDLAESMKDYLVDCIALVPPIGSAQLIDIASSREIRLLPVTPEMVKELQKINSAYAATEIPAGTYNGVNQNVPSVGAAAHLIVSSDLSEERVYEMTKVLVTNAAQFGDAHAAFKGLNAEKMSVSLGTVPMHPGAERYYREVGAIK